MKRPVLPPEVRFWAKVDKDGPGGCRVWTAGRTHGYGQFVLRRGVTVRAHRYAWELLRGAIPAGLVVDHLCRVRCCVNPGHMELISGPENTRRGIQYRPPGAWGSRWAPWVPPKGWRAEWERTVDAVQESRRSP